MKRLLSIVLMLIAVAGSWAAERYSVAGLYQIVNSGRLVYNFNQGWRFALSDHVAQGGKEVSAKDFDDSKWEVVCVPHSPLLTPSEGSGGRNYQGVCWYRKHFTMPQEVAGKNVVLHFEAVMGKQKIWVNGNLVKEHEGGYLPINIDLTACGLQAGEEAVIAVMADNSDDKTYPPGKKQSQLDFCYHGGIYRDVWMIAKNSISITDAVERNRVAGGGVFVHYSNINKKSAEMFVDVEIENHASTNQSLQSNLNSRKATSATVIATLKDCSGNIVATMKQNLKVKDFATAHLSTKIQNPQLWSPENPYLYDLEIRVQSSSAKVQSTSLDGGMLRIGIRSFEFKGREGFWLNGEPYRQLIGGNRHQDFAYVGNALPNSQQWRDAKRLKDAGMNIIRVAHYPQDPSFMDACDELGIFVIVATPGWQFWNKEPYFGEKVHQNTKDIIRRDRNHPCVLMWEPILNETRYPQDFALEALKITKEEYPYPYRPVAAADMNSAGVKDNYDVIYGWTTDIGKEGTPTDKCIFTREFGEMVDDWYSHNNLNRAARHWGERPQLMQAMTLNETYNEMLSGIPSPHSALKAPSKSKAADDKAAEGNASSLGKTLRGDRQFIGGALWHPFDHQRGYHPDPYFGGIYDAFRQKKYAFEMFRGMDKLAEPMVFIANEMTQFSDDDVIVFSNCDSVRLTAYEGDKVLTVLSPEFRSNSSEVATTSCYGVFTFPSFWNFWEGRNYSYFQKNWQKVSLLAEGFKDGKIVCSQKKMPSRRSTKLRLYVDDMGKQLQADGSDFVVVVCEVTDDNGNVKRLATDDILFTIEGEGRIVGDGANINANPRRVEWGSAPCLVQSTNTPGTIKITARSYKTATYAPTEATITLETIAPEITPLYKDKQPLRPTVGVGYVPAITVDNTTDEERQRMLEEVNKQQMEFGIGN